MVNVSGSSSYHSVWTDAEGSCSLGSGPIDLFDAGRPA